MVNLQEVKPRMEERRGMEDIVVVVADGVAAAQERIQQAPTLELARGAAITVATTKVIDDAMGDPLAGREDFLARAREFWPRLDNTQRASLRNFLPELDQAAE